MVISCLMQSLEYAKCLAQGGSLKAQEELSKHTPILAQGDSKRYPNQFAEPHFS